MSIFSKLNPFRWYKSYKARVTKQSAGFKNKEKIIKQLSEEYLDSLLHNDIPGDHIICEIKLLNHKVATLTITDTRTILDEMRDLGSQHIAPIDDMFKNILVGEETKSIINAMGRKKDRKYYKQAAEPIEVYKSSQKENVLKQIKLYFGNIDNLVQYIKDNPKNKQVSRLKKRANTDE